MELILIGHSTKLWVFMDIISCPFVWTVLNIKHNRAQNDFYGITEFLSCSRHEWKTKKIIIENYIWNSGRAYISYGGCICTCCCVECVYNVQYSHIHIITRTRHVMSSTCAHNYVHSIYFLICTCAPALLPCSATTKQTQFDLFNVQSFSSFRIL